MCYCDGKQKIHIAWVREYDRDEVNTNMDELTEIAIKFDDTGSGGRELLYTLSAQYIPSKIVIHT